MNKIKMPVLQKVCLIAGLCLLVAAAAVLALWQWQLHHAARQAENYVATLRATIPTPKASAIEPRSDNTMAVLSLDGTDFVGLLELPQYDLALPVAAAWGKVSRYPCRFDGSLYDSSLQIGATTQKGQFDFYRELSLGDTVLFTDVEGNRYTLSVTSLRYEKHADQAALRREAAPLTLFLKNPFSFEYLVLSCNVSY